MNRSNVILDFIFDDGLLFVSLSNIGDGPATDVAVEFDRPIHGADGVALAERALFRKLAFLAPRREITAFVFSGGGPQSAQFRGRDLSALAEVLDEDV